MITLTKANPTWDFATSPNGTGMLTGSGTWAGAVLNLEYAPLGAPEAFRPVPRQGGFNQDFAQELQFAGCHLRAVIHFATDTTSIQIELNATPSPADSAMWSELQNREQLGAAAAAEAAAIMVASADATTKANTAQFAAIFIAAADATSKANAAQAAATAAASNDATTKANAARSAAEATAASALTAGLSGKVDKAAGQSLMTDAERTKLGGISAGATVNATDAALRDRATHSGMQDMATITGLSAALASLSTIRRGIATVAGSNGRATFEFTPPFANGVVPIVIPVAVKPTGSTPTYNAQIYGDPTKDNVTVEVNTIPAGITGILGAILIAQPAPAGTKVHILALAPP